MRISQLIQRLKDLQAEEGDIQVVCGGESGSYIDGYTYDPDSVEYAKVVLVYNGVAYEEDCPPRYEEDHERDSLGDGDRKVYIGS